MVLRPDAGSLIPGGGGLRKLRWAIPGKGKSGGVRTIYYWNQQHCIYMLFYYTKNKQENLTPKELSILKVYLKDNLL